jgi:hypothetical protein
MKLFALIAILSLGACTALVPSGVARLYQFSPMEAEPKDIAVALRLPASVDILDDSARIEIMASRIDTDESSSELYILRRRSDTSGDLVIFDIDTADRGRMRDQQALIRDWEAENEKATSGAIGVTFTGCAVGTGPTATDRVSILMRTSAEGTFFPLVRNATVQQALDVLDLDVLEPCP